MRRLCIDLGGTNMRIALVEGKNIYNKLTFTTNANNPQENIKQIIEYYEDEKLDFKQIYLCCPGPLSEDNSMIEYAPNLPGWNFYPFKKEIEEVLDVELIIINDANAATLGEALLFEQYSNVLYFTISTGFGAGLSINKKIYLGENNASFEIKDYIVEKPSNLKYDKLEGLEAFTSGTGIYKLAKLNGLDVKNTKEVFELATKENEVALEILDYVKTTIVKFLSNCCYLINPGAIVLGGSVILNNLDFYNEIKDKLHAKEDPLIQRVNLELADKEGNSGLVGLSLL